MGDGIDVVSAREKTGIAIGQLAKKIGITEAKLIQLESDPSNIPAKLATNIATALGLNIDDLDFLSTRNE